MPENEDHTAEVPAVIERDLVRNLAQYSDRASVDWQAANKWWPAKTNYETWQKLAKRSLFKTFKKKVQDIVKELSLPPVKVHCSVLAEDAIKAAISDWKDKKK